MNIVEMGFIYLLLSSIDENGVQLTAADLVEFGSAVDDSVAAVGSGDTAILAGTSVLVAGTIPPTLPSRAYQRPVHTLAVQSVNRPITKMFSDGKPV